ncbi:MAG: DUF6600 domain-containing protein [Chthoniobacterales bacterium]
MKRILLIAAAVTLASLGGCQKQETAEERNAQVEREVQNRLEAEHQAQQQQDLVQREADLKAREDAVAQDRAAEPASVTTAVPARSHRETELHDAGRGTDNSYDLFYTRLEPYGSWMETRDYGYVWQPREAASGDWRPYANGHWVYTDAGWTWVSAERFGWATYHYGRWSRLRNLGWVWVPGDEWAPAWVSWRKSDDYVGWAPLPPEAQFDRRSGIRNWADNYYDIGPAQYCFVPTTQFGAERVERTIVPSEQNIAIINRTTNVTNITYNNVTVVNQGPSYDELRSRSQQPIPRLRLERQVTIDGAAQPHEPVVRGEVIQMIAPEVRRAQAARPREIRQTIAQTEADHGWAEAGNSDAARQAREKMKSEATPPPDAPSKAIVRNDGGASTGSPGSAQNNQSSAPPAISPSEATTRASASANATSTPTSTPRMVQTPRGTASPSASGPYVSPSTSASMTPRRAPAGIPAAPTSTPAQAATTTPASSTVTPMPSAPGSRPNPNRPMVPHPGAADNEPPKVGGRFNSQAKRIEPTRIEPYPPGKKPANAATSEASVTPAPSATVTPTDATSPRQVQPRPDNARRRVGPTGRRPNESGGPETMTTPSPSPTASASPPAA